VFQFEGQGMRDCLRQYAASRFEDLVAGGGAVTPGPMANIPPIARVSWASPGGAEAAIHHIWP